MKTVAYLRVSTGSQDLANQKMAVLDYAREKRFTVDRFVEVQASSRKNLAQRGIEELLDSLAAGDRLIVSELSRLGRSLGQVIRIVDELVKQKVRFVAIKEGIRFEGKQDMQTKVMVTLFGLFAEVERDLISQRTKEGLAAARAKGRLLGRPKGALGRSKLDGKEEEIRMLLEKTVSKASIAKIVDVSRTALHHFIRTRKLDAKTSKGQSKGRRPKVINVGVRDATYVLDGLLYHESDLRIEEHYTDTAGFTDHVFALMHLLGFRFAPRIRDLADKRLFVPAKPSAYPALSPLVGGTVNSKSIRAHWDEILRLATSIRQGTVTASLMLRKLGSYPRQNGLAVALRELGRIERTLFTLDWLQSVELRRRVQAGLNEGGSQKRLGTGRLLQSSGRNT